jgi:hypothetical protein
MASTIAAGTTSGTAIAIAGDTSGVLQLQTNGTTAAVTIDTSQNVGIGTASPSRKLQVHEATAATNAYFQLSNAATGSGATDGFQAIVGTGGEVILAQRENAEMQFWTNNTEQARITSAGLLQFNSGYGSVATAYGCRVWINFNGTGTVAVRGSGNVSSVGDNGTGNYTINIASAMPDANYSAVATARATTTNLFSTSFAANVSAGSFNIITVQSSGATTDPETVCCSVFR